MGDGWIAVGEGGHGWKNVHAQKVTYDYDMMKQSESRLHEKKTRKTPR
jgi:hypothetical protein